MFGRTAHPRSQGSHWCAEAMGDTLQIDPMADTARVPRTESSSMDCGHERHWRVHEGSTRARYGKSRCPIPLPKTNAAPSRRIKRSSMPFTPRFRPRLAESASTSLQHGTASSQASRGRRFGGSRRDSRAAYGVFARDRQPGAHSDGAPVGDSVTVRNEGVARETVYGGCGGACPPEGSPAGW